MITVFVPELRAVFRSGAGDEVTVQLSRQSCGSGLSLGISSSGFNEQRYLSSLDMIELGGALIKLGMAATQEGGAS